MSEKLLKKADAMKKRFHLFQLRSMQKEVESTEATLLMKLFIDDLKHTFEQEKLQAKEQEPEVKPEPSPTSFKHLILSSAAATHSLDFDLNPLKRHLAEPDSDDPDDFQDETSTHRTIKHHSPNFANKLLLLQGRKTEAASSFTASSSEGPAGGTNKHLAISTSYTDAAVKDEGGLNMDMTGLDEELVLNEEELAVSGLS